MKPENCMANDNDASDLAGSIQSCTSEVPGARGEMCAVHSACIVVRATFENVLKYISRSFL